MKILVLSDLHLGRKDSKCKECLEMIKDNPTDEIILNGDIFDQISIFKDRGKFYKEHHSEYVKEFINLMKERKTKVLYTVGNHDSLALLLIPFGFLFGIKIRKRFTMGEIVIEHGDWIRFYLKLRRIFNRNIEVFNDKTTSDDDHKNFYNYAVLKNKRLIVGHTHSPCIISNMVYDEGDWVGNKSYLFIEDGKIILP